MTFGFFEAQMGRLSGLKFRPGDLQTHWEALKDLPDPVLEAAVGRAQKTRVEFPTPFELRQDADAVRHHALPAEAPEDRTTELAQPFVITVPGAGTVVSVTREWSYYCEACSDSGWRSMWCGDAEAPQRKPWQPVTRCERRGDHDAHEWTQRCTCYETNPDLVRKRATHQKYADAPGKKVA